MDCEDENDPEPTSRPNRRRAVPIWCSAEDLAAMLRGRQRRSVSVSLASSMKTPQQVIESLLAERAEMEDAARARLVQIYQKHYASDYVQCIQLLHERARNNRETFSIAEVLDSSATILTLRRRANRQEKHRYHLRRITDSWEIHREESECFACDGTGLRRGESCEICAGKGWKDYLRDANANDGGS